MNVSACRRIRFSDYEQQVGLMVNNSPYRISIQYSLSVTDACVLDFHTPLQCRTEKMQYERTEV